jgi:ubiquinone/menaquinone biosynthesis C-methylase UbiE
MYRQLGVLPNGSILDVGCGTGEWLIYLREEKKHQGRLVGLDISPGIMSSGIEASRQRRLEIVFIVGSADRLPFPDHTFDAITAHYMLYHMPDIPKTLREIRRVLRPGGSFATSTNSKRERPKYEAFLRTIEETTQCRHRRFYWSFTLENGEVLLRQVFSRVERFEFESQIVLRDPALYVAYIDSVRDFFEPIPNDQDWEKTLVSVRSKIEREILQTGQFVEDKKRGFFIAST